MDRCTVRYSELVYKYSRPKGAKIILKDISWIGYGVVEDGVDHGHMVSKTWHGYMQAR